jgi:hypothetical protein
MMVGMFADSLGCFGVPNQDISIGSLLDHTLAWVHVEDPCGLGGGCTHKVGCCDRSCVDSLSPHN